VVPHQLDEVSGWRLTCSLCCKLNMVASAKSQHMAAELASRVFSFAWCAGTSTLRRQTRCSCSERTCAYSLADTPAVPGVHLLSTNLGLRTHAIGLIAVALPQGGLEGPSGPVERVPGRVPPPAGAAVRGPCQRRWPPGTFSSVLYHYRALICTSIVQVRTHNEQHNSVWDAVDAWLGTTSSSLPPTDGDCHHAGVPISRLGLFSGRQVRCDSAGWESRGAALSSHRLPLRNQARCRVPAVKHHLVPEGCTLN
jgi:hypothetical protein